MTDPESDPRQAGAGGQLAIALIASPDAETAKQVFESTLREHPSVQGKLDVAGQTITTLVGIVKYLRDVAPDPGEVDRVLQGYAAYIAARPTE